jgi:hypothetical protein
MLAYAALCAYGAGADTQASDEPPTLEAVAARLSSITDIAPVSMEDRKRILRDIGVAIPPAQTKCSDYLAQYAKNSLTCVDWLVSTDFGDRAAQISLSQRMVMNCLRASDALDLETEFSLIAQMEEELDASGKAVSGHEWSTLRNAQMEYRLHLWRRIDRAIDPSWDPKDVGWYGGCSPEEISDPAERKKYEAVVEANQQKNLRYIEQRHARDLRDRYLPCLKATIARLYAKGPTSQDDLDMLKAYLRVYVPAEKVRTELFEVANKAAKQAKPATAPSEQPK